MAEVVDEALLRAWPLPQPDDDADKNERGRVVIAGGSVAVPGGVYLSALAALRAGAGKVQVVTTERTAVALAVAMPEVLVTGVPETDDGGIDPSAADQILDRAADAGALLVGPGMVDRDAIGALVERVTADVDRLPPLVLDAAAMTCAPLPRLAGNAVLTPNASELAHLGDDAAEVAARLDAVVLAFGEITAPDGRAWRHDGGGPGLATSGSGDVLAGIVAGLLARTATPAQAAVHAAFVHARAGERLARRIAPLGFLARELLDEIAPAMAALA